MKFSAIITAGGNSTRFGSNKLLEKINGKEVIKYSVETFLNAGIEEIIICGGDYLKNIFPDLKVVQGGETRQQSVYNGLCAIDCDYVLIHDGARPMVTTEIIENVKLAVIDKKAVSVMTKTVDTIKEVDENGKIIKTLDRAKLYNTQTPQAFEYNLIKSIHERLKGQNFTDDAGMVEFSGHDVFMVDGSYKNIKITTKSDISIAQIYLSAN